MAIDYQGIVQQIRRLGEGALDFQRQLNAKKERARALLQEYDLDGAALREKVQGLARRHPSLRCALPAHEPLTTHHPCPSLFDGVILLAADGSQITPDRHAQVNYYLVNVGAIQMRLGSGEAPRTHTRSRIVFGEELFTPQGVVSSEAVFLQRDLQERKVLADLVEEARDPASQDEEAHPVVTLTDGTLELWGTKEYGDEAAAAFKSTLEKYKECLQRLHSLGAITAAYVDKPRADLVVRLLEIAALDENSLEQSAKSGPLRGVTDEMIFEEILGEGERSAVFGLQSQSAQGYKDQLALHFFYLNAGSQKQPWIARVEIPAWVVAASEMLDTLHAVLIQQCRTLANAPYPYALHRAHETAVVTVQDKEQVTQMIIHEYLRRGLPAGQISHKQHLKDQPGRTRL